MRTLRMAYTLRKSQKDNYFEKYYLFWPLFIGKIKERKIIMIKKHDYSGENCSC